MPEKPLSLRTLELQLKNQTNPKNIIYMAMFVIGFASILAQLAQSTIVTNIPLIGPALLFIFKGVQPGLLGFGVILKWLLISFVAIAIFNIFQGFIQGYFIYDLIWTVIGQTALVGILIVIILMLPQVLPGLYKTQSLLSIIGG
jgi:hypothetical protein